jgi:hypothetical protein
MWRALTWSIRHQQLPSFGDNLYDASPKAVSAYPVGSQSSLTCTWLSK